MWIYAPEKEATVSASGGNDSSTTRVAQFGTLSVNSNTLGISNQVWGNTNVHFGAGTLAVVVMTVVTKFIKRRLTSALAGEAVETAAGAAATEAGTELAVEGVVEAATWITITASIAGLVVGIAAGIAAYYLIMFIANFVWKSYRISISIHNWSSNDYIVDSYYADNAKIEGEKEFKETRLPAAGSMFSPLLLLSITDICRVHQNAGLIPSDRHDVSICAVYLCKWHVPPSHPQLCLLLINP